MALDGPMGYHIEHGTSRACQVLKERNMLCSELPCWDSVRLGREDGHDRASVIKRIHQRVEDGTPR